MFPMDELSMLFLTGLASSPNVFLGEPTMAGNSLAKAQKSINSLC